MNGVCTRLDKAARHDTDIDGGRQEIKPKIKENLASKSSSTIFANTRFKGRPIDYVSATGLIIAACWQVADFATSIYFVVLMKGRKEQAPFIGALSCLLAPVPFRIKLAFASRGRGNRWLPAALALVNADVFVYTIDAIQGEWGHGSWHLSEGLKLLSTVRLVDICLDVMPSAFLQVTVLALDYEGTVELMQWVSALLSLSVVVVHLYTWLVHHRTYNITNWFLIFIYICVDVFLRCSTGVLAYLTSHSIAYSFLGCVSTLMILIVDYYRFSFLPRHGKIIPFFLELGVTPIRWMIMIGFVGPCICLFPCGLTRPHSVARVAKELLEFGPYPLNADIADCMLFARVLHVLAFIRQAEMLGLIILVMAVGVGLSTLKIGLCIVALAFWLLTTILVLHLRAIPDEDTDSFGIPVWIQALRKLGFGSNQETVDAPVTACLKRFCRNKKGKRYRTSAGQRIVRSDSWMARASELAHRGFELKQLLSFCEHLGSESLMPSFDAARSTTNDVVREAIIPLSWPTIPDPNHAGNRRQVLSAIKDGAHAVEVDLDSPVPCERECKVALNSPIPLEREQTDTPFALDLLIEVDEGVSEVDEGGMALASVLEGRALLAERMVSHAWVNTFTHTVATMVADALSLPTYEELLPRLSQEEIPALKAELCRKGVDRVVYWLCAMSVNQHDNICAGFGPEPAKDSDDYIMYDMKRRNTVTGEIYPICSCPRHKHFNDQADDCEINKFDDMLRIFQLQARCLGSNFRLVAAVDPSFQIFGRIWCVAEFVESRKIGIDIKMKLLNNQILHEKGVFEKLQNIKVQNCQASRQADVDDVLAKIGDNDAHEDFNKFLHKLIFDADSGVLVEHLDTKTTAMLQNADMMSRAIRTSLLRNIASAITGV